MLSFILHCMWGAVAERLVAPPNRKMTPLIEPSLKVFLVISRDGEANHGHVQAARLLEPVAFQPCTWHIFG